MVDAADDATIRERVLNLRGDVTRHPEVSVVIPVNAQADLDNVVGTLKDIVKYHGDATVEIVLVVNNFPPGDIPSSVARLEQIGTTVITVPSVRWRGIDVSFAARMHGLRSVTSKHAIFFDADCRIPKAHELTSWYIQQFREGADVAYSQITYFDTPPSAPLRVFLHLHFLSRWIKRAIFRIPTTQGGSWGGDCALVLDLYDRGYLADAINVGPTVKAHGGRIRYSGRLHVEASGRYLTWTWRKLFRYFWFRFKYNIRVLPVRPDAASRTSRNSSSPAPQSREGSRASPHVVDETRPEGR